ncbi:MAG: DUF721 domain-containing protein [Bacteroidota bacterium]|nr:DUF721 domain-containing protein [Candidatus Kapabacteria bacterium]MDW8219960.1 DUF721 domain-containing protein [Bacteroidota bacterium]
MMENESATPLAEILRNLAVRTGLDRKLRESLAMEYWKEIIGEVAARSCVVQRIERGTLYSYCSSPVWRTELYLRKEDIIRRLNERIGSQVIRDIVLK